MMNEIPSSATLTMHVRTKGFVYYISKKHARTSLKAIMKREHFFDNFKM